MKKIFLFAFIFLLLGFLARPSYGQMMGTLDRTSVSDEQLGERTMEFMMGKEADEQMDQVMGPELSKRMHEIMGQRARLGYGMRGIWGRGMMGNNSVWSIFSTLWVIGWILGLVLLVVLIRYFWKKGR